MNKRVLITGGTGFVGSHAIETYARAGWKVRALVRNPQRRAWAENTDVDVLVGALDDRSIAKALADCDVVVHCAAITKTTRREEYYRVNSDAVQTLVEAARASGIRRFVFCSSQAASGPAIDGEVSREDDPPHPLTDYGKSKLAGEERLKSNCGAMDWIILRPPSILGPRDEQFVPLFRGIAWWGLYPRFGSHERAYSYIYVKDFARALLLAGEVESGANQTYFVAHPEPLDWKSAAAYIARLAQKNVRPLFIPVQILKGVGWINEVYSRMSGKAALLSADKVREILAGPWICSSEKIRRAWGFNCEYSTERALSETLEYYRLNGRL